MLLRRLLAVLCACATIFVTAASGEEDRVIPFDLPGPYHEIPKDALPPGELDVLRVRSSNPAINAAFTKARASLPAALAATIKSHGRFSPSLAVYVAVKVDDPGRQIEFVWVDNLRRDGKGFAGTLASHPRYMPGKRLRSPISFLNPQIADWAVQAEDGRYYGYFTTRAMLAHMEDALAHQIRAILVERAVPLLWQ
jgi:uncharacterized protein YegJ (DUF2314 family)